MHLQLGFVQSGYGVGLLPARFIARNHSIDSVKVLRPPSFDLHRSVAIVRVGQLGAPGKAVELLEQKFQQLIEAADTPKPVTRAPKRCARESAGGATADWASAATACSAAFPSHHDCPVIHSPKMRSICRRWFKSCAASKRTNSSTVCRPRTSWTP